MFIVEIHINIVHFAVCVIIVFLLNTPTELGSQLQAHEGMYMKADTIQLKNRDHDNYHTTKTD